MADMTLFQWQALTATARKFIYPEFILKNMWPTEQIDGTIARWDIEKPNIDIDTSFVHAGGPSQAIKPMTFGTTTQQMLTSFKDLSLGADMMIQSRQLGSDARDVRGRARIAIELANIRKKYGDYLDEWLIAQMLTGSMSVTLGGAAMTFNYGIPSSNKPTAAASWATASTDIVGDLIAWKILGPTYSGRAPDIAICNDKVMGYLMNNDTVQAYMGSTAKGVQIAESGQITNFMGLEWIVHNRRFASAGATEAFNTPFIAEDKVILMPRPTVDITSLQQGTVAIPDNSMTEFVEAPGMSFWSEVKSSPTGIQLYMKYPRLPALRVPAALVYADVVP